MWDSPRKPAMQLFRMELFKESMCETDPFLGAMEGLQKELMRTPHVIMSGHKTLGREKGHYRWIPIFDAQVSAGIPQNRLQNAAKVLFPQSVPGSCD